VPHRSAFPQGFKTNPARVCNRTSMDFLILCSLASALVDLSAGWSGLGRPSTRPPNTEDRQYRPKEATVMMLKRTTSLAFATASLTAIATMPAHAQTAGPYGPAPGYNTPQSSVPQANAAQSASARRNVIESHQYDREVETNRAFRQARMRKECGPITDPELRQSCLASFNQEDSQMGSSTSSRSHGSGSGR
jgi:hypothetical protein